MAKASDTSLGSTVPRRQLGRELRKLREEAGLTISQASEALGRSGPTLWRIEKGGSPMRPGDVAGMCLIYGASPEVTDALVALAKETNSPGWWRSYHGAIPRWFDTYVGLESAATHIRGYNDSEIPGLLQTSEYADVLFRGVRPAISDEEREERLKVRLGRQRILTRSTPPPPRLEVILGESVLLRRLPDPAAMPEQLRRLIDASELPSVSVRVLPAAESLGRAQDPRFNILSFRPDRRGQVEPPVVYVEAVVGALYLTNPAEVETYNQMWQEIDAAALSEFESLKLIYEQIERYQD